jgi:hypothetical protein
MSSNLQNLFKLELKAKDWKLYLQIFYIHFLHKVLAALAGVLSFGFLLIATYLPEIKLRMPDFPSEQISLVILASLIMVSVGGVVIKNKSWTQRVLMFVQSMLCYFFSISYFLSIDVTLFKIILLPILSFLLVYTHFLIFSAKQLPFAVVVGYVVLFVLQGFSLVSLIQKQEAIWESSDITLLASAIFRSQLFWLIITAFGVTFTTIKKIAASKPLSIQLTFASIYFVVLSQIILVTHVFSPADFLYWQKMITVVILWDFIYMPFSVTINDIKDDHFRSRLLVYSAYHSLLLVAVFFISFIT